MQLRTCIRPLAPVSLLFACFTFAQQPPPAQQTQSPPAQASSQLTTLRARAKLVVIDVVVTGKDKAPYKGLTAKDFTLTEGGKPQVIKQFEEHTGLSATEAAKFPPIPPMPPGVFTNFTPTPINSAVNILLLDALNTPLKDQSFVRSQLLDYIKKAKPGTSVAIFGLTTQLRMLQGFTSDPETLRQAVKMSQGKFSPLLDDAVGGGSTESLSDSLANFGPDAATAAAGISNLESLQQSFQLQMRAKYTLDALTQLGRYLANIPGRKNLIWFSGSFPIDILPDGEAADPFLAVADSEDEYREATNLLARAQVAVYPIDARGLQTLPMFSAANSGAKYVRNPNAFGKDLADFNSAQAGEHGTMLRMAQDTGGQAFINTNGLSQAVGKAIEIGSNYYTLAYTPTDDKWKGDFRKIKVELAKKGYELAYRHGYYADDPDSPNAAQVAQQNLTAAARTAARPDSNAMFQAMVHGLPGPTQILYKVRVLPATTTSEPTVAPGNVISSPGFAKVTGPFRRYLVDFAAAPSDLAFTVGPDGQYHLSLEFVTLVYQPDGQVAVVQSNTVDGDLTPQKFAAMRKGGVQFHQEISVPEKGAYSIRTGVHDLRNNRIGAVELPVSAVVKLAPPAPPAPATAPPAPAK